MGSNRVDIWEANGRFGCPEERLELISPNALEEQRRLFQQAVMTGAEIDNNQEKAIQFSYAKKFLEDWCKNYNELAWLTYENGQLMVVLPDGEIMSVPIEKDLSIANNVQIFNAILRQINKREFEKKGSPQTGASSFEVGMFSSSEPAITTASVYYYFATEAVSEGFSNDWHKLDQDRKNARIKSAFQSIATLAGNLEHTLLGLLDEISTMIGKNPFILNAETDQISLKSEVLEILKLGASFILSKEPNQNTDEFLKTVFLYTQSEEAIRNILELFKVSQAVVSRGIIGCPANTVKIGDTSLIKKQYEQYTGAMLSYFEFISKKHPELQANQSIHLDAGYSSKLSSTSKILLTEASRF